MMLLLSIVLLCSLPTETLSPQLLFQQRTAEQTGYES